MLDDVIFKCIVKRFLVFFIVKKLKQFIIIIFLSILSSQLKQKKMYDIYIYLKNEVNDRYLPILETFSFFIDDV